MDKELVEFLEQRFEKTEQLIEATRAESRADNRETRILIEDLRGQIQLVAEGVDNQNQRMDRFEERVAEEFRETKALIRLPTPSSSSG